MDDVSELLAASHACGGHTDILARWIRAAEHGALESATVMHQAALPTNVVARFSDADRVALMRSWHVLVAAGWQQISIADQQRYPALLRQLSDAPGLLYVRGDARLLHTPQLAIVGARGASTEGLSNAKHFAGALAQAGFTITSGLALGVDANAHAAALNHGATIAVLGHGPDRIYPPRNQHLAAEIAARGLLVTEYPPGMPPRREHFPARNRVISGLSLAVIVIEAAANSGSLITARLAAQQGRDVFAVPGSIHNPFSRGCHQLLRDGALWLEQIDDVLAHFDVLRDTALAAQPQNSDPLLSAFVSGVNSLDALASRSGLDWQQLHQALFTLELAGQVEKLPGGYARCF